MCVCSCGCECLQKLTSSGQLYKLLHVTRQGRNGLPVDIFLQFDSRRHEGNTDGQKGTQTDTNH